MQDFGKISVARYAPERHEATLDTFDVPLEPGATVMGALMYIYEKFDSTLAFHIGCRNEYCGLCAVDVNGKARLACMTPLRDGLVIRPLQKLPVSRDLIVDRSWILSFLRRFQLFVNNDRPETSRPFTLPDQLVRLSGCTECLSCVAACPSFDFAAGIGGPYHFVKLAQLHWDPRDNLDRRTQAKDLGIARCAECRKCACPLGIPVYKMAVAPLSRVGSGADPVA